MIPLFVDCSRRRIVIFGGGEVAARKAAYFSKTADVTVVSRSFVPAFDELKITRKELDLDKTDGREFAELLTGAFLVIAALSSPDINNRIGKLCRATGILFNNADGETGDVILPSVTGGDNYTLAISTQGRSPAISRFIREHLEQTYPAMDEMISLQQRLRSELKRVEPEQLNRDAILWQVLKDPIIWTALSADTAGAWNIVKERYLHD
ncbi:MAG: bifunctional precorrin-2 dehydrogenase/sirohydrochlorin ferrochelatase [Methanoregula sp.]|nr:bifunctional precorrin-2 dehydrogenase/sirohydrochlorin ferrochelatase [Methanoregula sp.]